MRKWTQIYLFLSILGLAGILAIIEAPGLRIELEGLTSNRNFRDVGQSINLCLQERKVSSEIQLKENLFFRSNKRFSGFSCSQTGNVSEIITLNYQPQRKRKYFCLDERKNPVIGYVPESLTIELSDLEFRKTWDDERMREPTCEAFKKIFRSIGQKRPSLVHCDAGRDRTGAFAAIISGMSLETSLTLDQLIEVLECDYTKSKSLTKDKYGRVANFVRDIYSNEGNLIEFIKLRCPEITPDEIQSAKTIFIDRAKN